MAKLINKLSICATLLLITGCASLKPVAYAPPDIPNLATLSLASPQGYTIGATTYENSTTCTKRLFMADNGMPKDRKTYKIAPDEEIAITVFLAEKKVYGHSCNYTVFFTPESNAVYSFETILDINSKVCTSNFKSNDENNALNSLKIVDSQLRAWGEQSAWCENVEPAALDGLNDVTTGLYHFSVGQALLYDYTPRRLTPN